MSDTDPNTQRPLEQRIKELGEKYGAWVQREIPDCGYGFRAQDGKLRVTLRAWEIDDAVQAKIDELKKLVEQEGYPCEYDIVETGVIRALKTEDPTRNG